MGKFRIWTFWHGLHFWFMYSACWCAEFDCRAVTQSHETAFTLMAGGAHPALILCQLQKAQETLGEEHRTLPGEKRRSRKATAPTEHFKHHLKDCTTQFWEMWQVISCLASCADKHACLCTGCSWIKKPMHRTAAACPTAEHCFPRCQAGYTALYFPSMCDHQWWSSKVPELLRHWGQKK